MDLAQDFPEFAKWMWSEKVNDEVDFAALQEAGTFPLAREILTVSVMNAIAFSATRYILEKFVLAPFFENFLTKSTAKRPMPFSCAELEKVYAERRLNLPDINEVKALSTKLGRNVEDINKWFKHRQMIDRDAIKVKRCTECVWRLVIYSSCFAMGLSLARSQPWFNDSKLCWYDMSSKIRLYKLSYSFSMDNNDAELRTYYIGVQLPLYAHLLIKALMEKRAASDRWEMLCHHALAVLLLTFSYLGNFLRLGCTAMLYLDITDVFLESSKLLSYLKWSGISNFLLLLLSFVWGYARIYKFATVVLFSGMVESREMGVIGASYYFFNSLLLVLFSLNFYWFYAIASIAYRIMWGGGYEQQRDRAYTDLSTDDGSDTDADY